MLSFYNETANTWQMIANSFHRLGKLLRVAANNKYTMFCIFKVTTFDSRKKVKYNNPGKDEWNIYMTEYIPITPKLKHLLKAVYMCLVKRRSKIFRHRRI